MYACSEIFCRFFAVCSSLHRCAIAYIWAKRYGCVSFCYWYLLENKSLWVTLFTTTDTHCEALHTTGYILPIKQYTHTHTRIDIHRRMHTCIYSIQSHSSVHLFSLAWSCGRSLLCSNKQWHLLDLWIRSMKLCTIPCIYIYIDNNSRTWTNSLSVQLNFIWSYRKGSVNQTVK